MRGLSRAKSGLPIETIHLLLKLHSLSARVRVSPKSGKYWTCKAAVRLSLIRTEPFSVDATFYVLSDTKLNIHAIANGAPRKSDGIHDHRLTASPLPIDPHRYNAAPISALFAQREHPGCNVIPAPNA